jgi:tetratricopeptide (TPR) repeat protein
MTAGWFIPGASCVAAVLLSSACASAGASQVRRPAAVPAAPAAAVSTPRSAPPARSAALTVSLESWDPALAAALAELSLAPTAEAHRRVAVEYRRLGVLDQAHAHFTQAVTLDPADAASFDALARIWRDWGFPELGMIDAQRSVQLVPESPEAANTMGTLLEAAGRISEARGWYERALAMDGNAAYALNNLCYSAIMLAQTDAVEQCRRALAAAPGARVVRNNMGLAYAAAGDLSKASELFDSRGELAYAQYNMGIVYMGTRQYDKALAAFVAAMRLDPQFTRATERARQAGIHLAAEGQRGRD